MSAEEISAIAAYTNTDPVRFVSEKCRMSGGKPVLAQRADGYCIFWDGQCGIHPVKPGMCRSWPFIRSVLIDVGNWAVMGSSCPGIRLDAPADVIIECVERELSRELKRQP